MRCMLKAAILLLLGALCNTIGVYEEDEKFIVTDPPPLPLRKCDLKESSCKELDFNCLNCSVPDCNYGEKVTMSCTPSADSTCNDKGDVLSKSGECLYCYQLLRKDYECESRQNCSTTSQAEQAVHVACWPKSGVFCLGRRSFYRKEPCNWTSGYRWSTAFVLSVTLGGFGADRFYLGLWQSGLGKLFSFGGLGVWTILDVILIGLGFVRPADGSIYIT